METYKTLLYSTKGSNRFLFFDLFKRAVTFGVIFGLLMAIVYIIKVPFDLGRSICISILLIAGVVFLVKLIMAVYYEHYYVSVYQDRIRGYALCMEKEKGSKYRHMKRMKFQVNIIDILSVESEDGVINIKTQDKIYKCYTFGKSESAAAMILRQM